MKMDIKETMQVALFLVSLSEITTYSSTMASIKTLHAKLATWSYVTMRLIEEKKKYSDRGGKNLKRGVCVQGIPVISRLKVLYAADMKRKGI